jgi:hypothetical protein
MEGLTLKQIYDFFTRDFQEFLEFHNITTVKTVEVRDFNNLTGKDEPIFKITKELCTAKIWKEFPEDELVNVLKELAFRDFVKNGLPAPRQTYSIEVLGDHGTISIWELL